MERGIFRWATVQSWGLHPAQAPFLTHPYPQPLSQWEREGQQALSQWERAGVRGGGGEERRHRNDGKPLKPEQLLDVANLQSCGRIENNPSFLPAQEPRTRLKGGPTSKFLPAQELRYKRQEQRKREEGRNDGEGCCYKNLEEG